MRKPGEKALRVTKLGGSLLSLADLASRVRAWLAREEPIDTLLLVGGGELADSIKRADERHQLGQTRSHWLCVKAMAIQAEIVAALLPEAIWLPSIRGLASDVPRVDSPSVPAATRPRRLFIVDPWLLLRDDDPNLAFERLGKAPLPATWDVSSDSIAARLAALSGAQELVLLKSAFPSSSRPAELVRLGFVDRVFPKALEGVARARIVNLRDDAFPSVPISLPSAPTRGSLGD